MGITVVGLGSGDENQLTLGVWRVLEKAQTLYLRTEKHPVCRYLREQGMQWQSFDAIYEKHQQFQSVYHDIAEQLLSLATDADVVYAVPGHPSVAEDTVRLLRDGCAARGISLQIQGGESFLDQAFLRLQIDPIDGFQLLDGTSFDEAQLNPYMHTIFAQVYDQFVASDVKLSLLHLYPADYLVWVGHALGIEGEEQILQVSLHELDHVQGYGNLSVIYVPRAEDESVLSRTFARLREIVAILRSPEGCPWDREQTHQSIRKNLIEETCEVLDTIDGDQPAEMCEELGDLLLQIMLHAQMEAEIGEFTVYDVIQALNEKLIRRHPHVFATAQANDAAEALRNWQQIKAVEKQQRGIDPSAQSILAGLPRELTALLRALKLQKKAATVGFDWPNKDDVIAKFDEEREELWQAMASGDSDHIEDEFGDLLFSLVNLARFLKLDPEHALARTNRKFERRFGFVEQQLQKASISLEEATLAQMDHYWNQAKQQEFPKK